MRSMISTTRLLEKNYEEMKRGIIWDECAVMQTIFMNHQFSYNRHVLHYDVYSTTEHHQASSPA
jgi:hypothetical protein